MGPIGTNTTYMDTDRMRTIVDGFEQAADILRAVNRALEAAMITLRVTAFVGLVGGAAVERYIANIQPQVEELEKWCISSSERLTQAIKNYEAAQQAGNSF